MLFRIYRESTVSYALSYTRGNSVTYCIFGEYHKAAYGQDVDEHVVSERWIMSTEFDASERCMYEVEKLIK